MSQYQNILSGSGVVASAGAYFRTSFTATSGQTTFSATYSVGYVQVYVNGVLLNAADYTATNGTSIILGLGAITGDIVEVVTYTSVAVGTSSAISASDTASASTFYPLLTPADGGVNMALNNSSLLSYVPSTGALTATKYNSPTTLSLQTGGTTAVTIDASQNVGIGTTSPGYKLDVNGSIGGSSVAVVGNYAANRPNATAYNLAGGIKFQVDGTSYAAIAQPSAQALAFYTNNDTTERMRIDSSGNVGIGTIPNAGFLTGNKFEINAGALGTTAGNISAATILNTNDGNVTVLQTYNYRVSNGTSHTTSEWRQQRIVDATRMGYTGYGSNYISFGQNTTEQMRIDSSGNVFVGGTTQNTATAPVYSQTTAKAFVNFNGISGSVAIRSSFNVSSVTRNALGNYTVNMTTALVDINYIVNATSGGNPTNNGELTATAFTTGSNVTTAPTASSFLISVSNLTAVYNDSAYVMCTVFR